MWFVRLVEAMALLEDIKRIQKKQGFKIVTKQCMQIIKAYVFSITKIMNCTEDERIEKASSILSLILLAIARINESVKEFESKGVVLENSVFDKKLFKVLTVLTVSAAELMSIDLVSDEAFNDISNVLMDNCASTAEKYYGKYKDEIVANILKI